jgi:hypothetical protein
MTPDVDMLLDRARSWAAADPDQQTRAELERSEAEPEAYLERITGTIGVDPAFYQG